jgi:hypothetical protein
MYASRTLSWTPLLEEFSPKSTGLHSTGSTPPVDLPDQLIHGDLNPDNILVADDAPPAIIDLAPYWRPAALAVAVLAYWIGPYRGNVAILEHFRGITAFDQMLVRAGLWKTLCQSDLGQATHLDQHEQAVGIIEKCVTSHR